MIVPGLVKPDYALDDQRNWMIDGLAAYAELAESRDLPLLAENIDTPEAIASGGQRNRLPRHLRCRRFDRISPHLPYRLHRNHGRESHRHLARDGTLHRPRPREELPSSAVG